MIPVVVRNIVTEAQGVVRVVLGSTDGAALPDFEAGRPYRCGIWPGGFDRQYSLCRMQAEAQYYEIAVLKDPQSRGGSAAIHQLAIGHSLFISPPKNHFSLVKTKRNSLLVAGGIGVTPMLPMAQQLEKMGLPFGVSLLCEIARNGGVFSGTGKKFICYKNAFPLQPSGWFWSHGCGEMYLSCHSNDSELYVCGPAEFISYVLLQAKMLGWPEERLHREFFFGTDRRRSNE